MNRTTTLIEWHRTSPVGAVFFLFNTVRQLALNALPAIVVVAAAYASGGADRKALMAFGLLALAVLGFAGSVLHWLRFRFAVTEDRVLVRSGVLHREELSVEFGRIQNINIREPVYMRPFGLAVVGIDTAGSSQKEILLGGIRKGLAVELRQTLLSAAGKQTRDEEAAPVQDAATPLLERDTRDLVIYGLTVNFFVWVALALGAFFGAWDTTEQVVEWLAERIRIADLFAAAQNSGDVLGNTLLIAGLVLAAILLLPLISVLGALVRHHGYHLTVDGETYRKSSGFLTRHEESLKQHKIQAIVLKQNFIARLFKRNNIQLRVASAGAGIENGQLPTGARATFLVPALHADETAMLCREFFPGCEIGSVKFSRINRGRLMMVVLSLVALPSLLLGLALGLVLSWQFLAVPLLAIAVAWLAAQRYWTKAGYAVVGDYGFVRKGFIGTTITAFPLFKVQRVDVRQTPGQRKHGLANLAIHLASHSLELPWILAGDSERFRDLALWHIETSQQAWY